MNAPIIFIHYNDSPYLKFTLESAVKKNPEKQVYLIGDDSNKKYEKLGVNHVYFKDYLYGELLEDYENVFQYIRGDNFDKTTYGEKWTRFNFRKWFVLSNFIKKNKISSFWMFDSDVLIIENLKQFEEKFRQYDYTTCSGDLYQLFGFVSSSLHIREFTKSIVDMFQDENYLNTQREIMSNNPTWGLTMMRAFQRFKIIKRINAIYIFNRTDIVSNLIFVDYNRGIPSKILLDSEKNIVLFFNRNGMYVSMENRMLRVPFLNMSWMPFYLMKRVFQHTNIKYEGENLIPLKFEQPILDKIKYKVLALVPFRRK